MSRIVKIVILSVVAALLIGLLIWGIAGRNMFYFYQGRLMSGEKPAVSDGVARAVFDTDVKDIGNIRLDFISESINVVVTDEKSIRIEEKADRELGEDELMKVQVNGDTMYAESGFKNDWCWLFGPMNTAHITVTLYVPADYQGNLKLSSTSGQIQAGAVNADTFEIDGTSGNIYIDGADANVLKINNVSGEMMVTDGEYERISADTVSGEISLDGTRTENLNVDAVSGSVSLQTDVMPERIDVNTISGDIRLRLPENDGFTFDFDSVSGNVRNDFAMVNNVHGNGENSIKAGTVSGSIDITKQ